jgi:hypothetical protein
LTRFALCLVLLTGCGKKTPDHLQIKAPEQAQADALPITDLSSALSSMVRKDPLARAPRLPDIAALESIEGTRAIRAYIRQVLQLERGDGSVQRDLQALEDEFPQTSAVALARGYRLRVVENLLATLEPGQAASEALVLELLTPLQGSSAQDTLPRPPLEWLVDGMVVPQAVRNVGERWVLTAWLRDPTIPIQVIGSQMQTPLYGGLADTPTGRLVRARVDGARGDREPGLEDLRSATRLALMRAAADRDSEQAAWSDAKKDAAAELGADAPIATHLSNALESLTRAAGDDIATGAALVALGALRWEKACEVTPCIGLDRVETMRSAEAWGDRHCDAEAWQVIALKESLDTMDVGHDTILFPKAIIDLTDALIGTGAGPLEAHLLRRRTPAPAVWLALGRSVGREAVTDWDGARIALGAHLEAQTKQARDQCDDDDLQPLFDRIIRRAVP